MRGRVRDSAYWVFRAEEWLIIDSKASLLRGLPAETCEFRYLRLAAEAVAV